jgi:hypothetical protein
MEQNLSLLYLISIVHKLITGLKLKKKLPKQITVTGKGKKNMAAWEKF